MIKIDEEIYLNLISLASAEVIFNSIHQSRSHLRRWLPFVDETKNVADTRHFIKSIINSNSQKKEKVFEIWFKKEFAGLIALKEIDLINQKSELGYWLNKEMTGKGIMLRSVNGLIKYAFEEMKLNRLVIRTAEGNEKSSAIPKTLGFYFEGVERKGEFLNNTFLDLEVYSLLKNESE